MQSIWAFLIMKTDFYKKIINPLLNILNIFLACISVFIISIFTKLIFGDASDNLMNYNPLFNGFIHADISHLLINLLLMFLVLMPEINQNYSFLNIYLITLIISIFYFPISLLIGIPAVGVSGTLYFMLSRICLDKTNIILFIFYSIMIVPEIISFANFSDGTAHIVHIIGASFGWFSLKEFRFNFLYKRM